MDLAQQIIDSAILDKLRCPECRSELSLSETTLNCNSATCHKVYNIADGVPCFAEIGTDVGQELEVIEEGASDSIEYQEQYQNLDNAIQYNSGYQDVFLKRMSTRREYQLLQRLLSSQEKCDTLLDLPCGGGRLSPQIEKYATRLIESDIGMGQVQYARKFCTLDTTPFYMTSTAFKLPLKDNSVDATVCIRLNHHMPTMQERDQLMNEILRVSKQFVIMTFFDYYSVKNTLRRIRKPFNKKPPKMTMKTSEVEAIANQHGFDLVARPLLSPTSSGHRYALMVKK